MKERRVDVAFWPAEEADGLTLFRKLHKKLAQKDFDDEYLDAFFYAVGINVALPAFEERSISIATPATCSSSTTI